ncbi:auxin-induced protein 22d [Phtheirospermum japonicum]|uniref:Auxin-responsive protein n=1 Tax=Phtheirospermum japonicum TaxID=374723 RepID=A0A830CID3_9LAMI|nr:auxin-induced protein 22d [Phtheirospermum japonicum]
MERGAAIFENDLNLKATELRLGLPGSDEPDQQQSSSSHVKINNNKRSCSEIDNSCQKGEKQEAQVVGWPPQKSESETNGSGFFVKVSMDGAPYLRKIDLKFYKNYFDLLKALENMFKCNIGVYTEREGYDGSEFAPTYEDKDGDWMLVGDVPWDMFITSCKRLRIMKGSEAKGLGCN